MPCIALTSQGPTPAARVLTLTSPGPADGSGRSPTLTDAGAPGASMYAAFITASSLQDSENPARPLGIPRGKTKGPG